MGWHKGSPGELPGMFFRMEGQISTLSYDYGIKMEDFNKLPKKDRQDILENAKEYVIQGDVDEVAARFEGNLHLFSHCLLTAFLSNHILQTFWGDNGPFWWLEPDLKVKDAKTVPLEFGAQLSSLYKVFRKADRYLADAWVMMTTRLSTITELKQGLYHDFGKCMKERRRSLLQSTILPELLAQKTMQLLLKDATSADMSECLLEILVEQAETAVLMYAQRYRVRFAGIEHMPTTYVDLPERERNEFKAYFKDGDDSPLHGKKVLAITQPASYRQGVLGSPYREKLISPGQFIIEWNYQDAFDFDQ